MTGERNVAGRRRRNEEAENKVGAGAPPRPSLRSRVDRANGLHGSGRLRRLGVWFPRGQRRPACPTLDRSVKLICSLDENTSTTVLASKSENIRNLFLGFYVRNSAADRPSLVVNAQRLCFGRSHGKETFQHKNYELHRSLVVIQAALRRNARRFGIAATCGKNLAA